MEYDIVFSRWIYEHKVADVVLFTGEGYERMYKIAKEIAEALYLKEGSGHDNLDGERKLNWLTVMPDDHEIAISIVPVKRKS